MNKVKIMVYLKPVEHRFKALFFNVCKGFLRKGQNDFEPLDGRKIQKVLFLRPEKIGDMVISLPVFDGLKKHFPHIKLSILSSPINYSIIKEDPRFDKIYIYRKNPYSDIKELIKIRQGNYDCVVDMICDDSVTALFLSQLCAPGKPRVGVGKVKFREYYDFNYDHRRNNTYHIIENTLKLLEAFNIDSERISCYASLFIKDSAERMAERFVNSLTNGDPSVIKIGYNLSAGSPTRIWAEEKSVALLKEIMAYIPKCQIILFTVPAERKRGVSVQQCLNGNISLVPDNLNLVEAAAIIKHLDLLITPDTSLVHIARAFKVSVVGLYSRFMKNFLLWRPYGQNTGAVVSKSDGNIFDITVKQVFEVFKQVIDERKLVKL